MYFIFSFLPVIAARYFASLFMGPAWRQQPAK
jgi:hypothetical protein